MTTTSWVILIIVILLVVGFAIYFANMPPSSQVQNPPPSSSSSSSSSQSPSSSVSGQTSVQVGTSQTLGQYLTDQNGATLYRYTKDTAGKSACTGPCATTWLPFSALQITAASPLDQNNFSTITRDDGTTQVTYKKQPLYYYSGDQQPGDTKGQAVDKQWYVVKP